jgi:flagellar basal-body rod protein FlgB
MAFMGHGKKHMLDRLTNSMDFHGEALKLRSERQRLIASNIANADTPNYVARDLDFSTALRQATGSQQAGGAPSVAATNPGHIGAGGAGGTSTAAFVQNNLVYSTPSQTNLDSNSVDMDRERANFADNTVRYEATLRFINGNVRTMLEAIKGQ